MKQIKIMSDQTADIYLQSISKQDASDEYVQWLNDSDVNQYLETRFKQQTLQSITEFIQSTVNNANEHLFTIRLKENNQHIGNIKVGPVKHEHNIADISLFIGNKNYWGKGIATQAIQLITRYSIEHLHLRKLSAGAYFQNKGSTQAFIKSGYTQDAILKNHFIFNDMPCDSVQVCFFKDQLFQLPKIKIDTN